MNSSHELSTTAVSLAGCRMHDGTAEKSTEPCVMAAYGAWIDFRQGHMLECSCRSPLLLLRVSGEVCVDTSVLVQVSLLCLPPAQLPGWQIRSGMQSWRMRPARMDWQQASSGSQAPPSSPLQPPSGPSRCCFCSQCPALHAPPFALELLNDVAQTPGLNVLP